MRKMADGFIAVRRAELRARWTEYDPEVHEAVLRQVRLAGVHRRGVRPLPADLRGGRRRRHARHRLPEPLAAAGLGQADPRGRPRHAGLLEHRRPGLHERLHRPGVRHGRLRQGQHGKEETRKELALIAIAHRGATCCSRRRRGLAPARRRPEGAAVAAPGRLPAPLPLPARARHRRRVAALQRRSWRSRAGPSRSWSTTPTRERAGRERLDLDGNPSPDESWPSYDLEYKSTTNGEGAEHDRCPSPSPTGPPPRPASRSTSEARPEEDVGRRAHSLPRVPRPLAGGARGCDALHLHDGEDRRLGRLLVDDEIVQPWPRSA